MSIESKFPEAFEDIRELVLDQVTHHPSFGLLLETEYHERFPKGVPMEQFDEVMCMCQLLVVDRILKGIIR